MQQNSTKSGLFNVHLLNEAREEQRLGLGTCYNIQAITTPSRCNCES